MVIYFTGWNIVDPIISILIAVFLFKSIYSLIKETLNALLDSVPSNIDYDKVKKDLLNIKNVKTISDLHIWLIDSHLPALSVHIQSNDIKDSNKIIIEAKRFLHDKYGIEHATLQVLPKGLENDLDCNHCN